MNEQEAKMSASISRALRVGALGATLVAGALAGAAAPAAAQQVASRVAAHQSWSVFTADVNGKVCWIVSEPTSSKAFKGGKQVKVNRGDIYMMVSVRPGQGVTGEVSVVSGYPYKAGSEVKAEIGSDSFAMFTKGENAWLEGPEVDSRMIAAMKRGITADVTGVSSRDTQTVDTFSLRGFTAAVEEAQKRCQ